MSGHKCRQCETALVCGVTWYEVHLKKHYYVCKLCVALRARAAERAKEALAIGAPLLVAAAQIADLELVGVRERHGVLLVELENRQTGVLEGFVYIITNPAWPGYVKIGKAIDYEARLGNAHTWSPFSDFKVEARYYSPQRGELEKSIHAAVDHVRVTGKEWFKLAVEDAKAVARLHSLFW